MGSGKSTVGPLVADQLGFAFLDLDDRVEQVAGRPIETLFKERGEGVFRALETAVLSQVLDEEESVVIATGGGALISEATMAMAKDGGRVVYLRAQTTTLADRLAADQARPLLKSEDGQALNRGELEERIEAIVAKRRRFYEQADAIIDVDQMGPPDIAAAVVLAVTNLTDVEQDR